MNIKTLLLFISILLSFVFCKAKKISETPSILEIQGGIGMQIDVENVEKGVPFNAFVAWIGNPSYSMNQNFFGSLALALIAEDGNIKQVIHEEKDVHLSPGYGRSHSYCGCKVDTDIAPTDIIRFITRENGLSEWCPVTSSECEITYCPVKDNTVHIADVSVNVLGKNDIPVDCYCWDTHGETLQEKPVYSAAYKIDIEWPEGKDHHFVTVMPTWDGIQRDFDDIIIQIITKPKYVITLMACSDEELITEQLHFTVNIPGTLADQLKDHENLIYINNISVSGNIDERDFRFMREQMPMLEHVDLSDARIYDDYLPDGAFECKGIKTLVLPPTLKGLGYNSLRGTKLFDLEIPEGVDYYGLNALNYSEDLTLLTLRNPKVIPVSWCVLEGTNRSKGALFVPEGAKDAFAANSEWGQFGVIVEGGSKDLWVSDSDNVYSYTGVYPEVVITNIINPADRMIVPETVELNGRTFNVTGIEERVFCDGCIKEIHIPKSIVRMGEYAIETSGCSSLEEIDVAEGNPVFFSHEGVIYDGTSRTMIAYPMAKREIEYEVPEGVEAIDGWACYNLYVEKIVFPSSLKNIGSCAFYFLVMEDKEKPVIISKAVTPPYLSNSAFGPHILKNAHVYVPAGSLDAYRTDVNWSSFRFILPFEEGLNAIGSDNTRISITGNTLTVTSDYPVEIYGIDGRSIRISHSGSVELPRGIYIVRVNGDSRKIKI